MPSRVSLSLLAFISGLVIMFVAAAYQLVDIPKASANTIGLILLFGGLIIMAIGWIRIFSRRPQRNSETDAS